MCYVELIPHPANSFEAQVAKSMQNQSQLIDIDAVLHHTQHDPHNRASALSDVILGGQDGLVNVLGVILGVAAATSDPASRAGCRAGGDLCRIGLDGRRGIYLHAG